MNTKARFTSVFSTLCLAAACCFSAQTAMAQDTDDERIEAQRSTLEEAYKKIAAEQQMRGKQRLEQYGLGIDDLKSEEEQKRNPLPDDLQFHSVTWNGERYIVRLEGSFQGGLENGDLADYQREMLTGAIAQTGVPESVRYEVRVPGSGEFVPLMPTRNEEELKAFLEETERFHAEAVKRYRDQAQKPLLRSKKLPYGGSLSGKKVLVSGGHGISQGFRVWTNGANYFSTQRGLCTTGDTRGIIEDDSNARFVNQWLIPLLQNMGAEVILVRESDMNSDGETIVDNSDADYSDTGNFASLHQNDGAQSAYRFTYGSDFKHSSADGAKATWKHTFGSTGYRRIQAWYPELSDRPSEVKYTITDAGGKHEVFANQKQYGRYRDLGRYWSAGGSPITVTVERTSGSGELIADAIKFRSGKETLTGSNYPWWQMDAWYYIHHKVFGTASPEIASRGVGARRELARRANADIYISMHSNATDETCSAGGGTANGFWVYTHINKQQGTDLYANLVNKAGLDSIHDRYDPNFCPLGIHQEELGELSGPMPSVLVEMAFHNNLKSPRTCAATGQTAARPDIVSLQYPQFREAVARGVADAIAQYFSITTAGGTIANYAKGAGLPPDRPTGLKAINGSSPCELTISWDKTEGAKGYRLYMIDNLRPNYERAWDAGTVTDQTSITLTNLTPGHVYAFKVAALNKNGEGFSSPAVTARLRASNQSKRGLYINGYTRWDAYINLEDNDLEYAAEHGIALGAASDDFFFDGALISAADSSNIDLSKYNFVDFQAGRNSSDSKVMSSNMMNKLTSYINGGGKLLISGSELGWALSYKNQGKDFFNNVLKGGSFAEAQDDAETYGLKGAGEFEALGNFNFDDGNHGIYQVLFPDYFKAENATSILNYDNGKVAGLASSNVIMLGIPVETIYPASKRAQFVGCSIQKLVYGKACTPKNHELSDDGAKKLACEAAAECTENEAICVDEKNIKKCTSGKWKTSACGTGKHCQNNACVDDVVEPDPAQCKAGEYKCQDENTRLIYTDGSWLPEACEPEKHCDNGTCVDIEIIPTPEQCQNDESKCQDENTRIICVDGNWLTESCEKGEVCNDGSCVEKSDAETPDPAVPSDEIEDQRDPVPANCDDDEAYCDDNYLVVCKDKAWHWTSCKSGKTCVETAESVSCKNSETGDDDDDDGSSSVKISSSDGCSVTQTSGRNPSFPCSIFIASMFGFAALRRRKSRI